MGDYPFKICLPLIFMPNFFFSVISSTPVLQVFCFFNLILVSLSDYLKFSSDYSHSVVGGTSSARGMRSASELRDLMDTLQRKKIALENSLRANGNANPSYFSVTQVGHNVPPPFMIYYPALYVVQ